MFCQIKFLSQNLQTKIRIKISLYGGEKERATPYILKAKKFAEPPFQSNKIAEKVWVILGHSWVIFGHFWAISWHFWTNLRKVKNFCGPVGVAGLAFRMYGQYIYKYTFKTDKIYYTKVGEHPAT